MNVMVVQTGSLQVNTYILHNETSKEAVIIDPGGNPGKIKRTLEEYGLTPKAVLLTHGHFDHIGAVKQMQEAYNPKVYIHEDDAELLTNPEMNLSAFFNGVPVTCNPADEMLHDGQVFEEAGMTFTVYHTPGHSMGSAVFLTEHAAFTGDTLFRMSIGRVDFSGSDDEKMKVSLQRLKDIIPGTHHIFPGHGEKSTFEYELSHNPYLTGWIE